MESTVGERVRGFAHWDFKMARAAQFKKGGQVKPVEHVNLINRIIEAENKARQIADEAQEKRKNLQHDLADAKVNMRQNYVDRANHRIAEISKREDDFAQETIAKLNEHYAAELAEMEEKFQTNRAAWAEKLFSMIVER